MAPKHNLATANWQKLKSKIGDKTNARRPDDPNKRKRCDISRAIAKNEKEESKASGKVPGEHMNEKMKSRYIGLDCEMVGIGPTGKRSALARCCMVDFDGNTIYDKFVRPKGFVTDFRTKYSGVRKQDLRAGQAITLDECQAEVAAMLKGKFLVGHALKNDLDALMLSHPRSMIRDTARYRPYMRPHGRKGGKFKPRALRELAKQFLGITIQSGEHDPGEDARTAVMLYRLKIKEWEQSLRDERKARIEMMKAGNKSKTATATTAAGGPISTSGSNGENGEEFDDDDDDSGEGDGDDGDDGEGDVSDSSDDENEDDETALVPIKTKGLSVEKQQSSEKKKKDHISTASFPRSQQQSKQHSAPQEEDTKKIKRKFSDGHLKASAGVGNSKRRAENEDNDAQKTKKQRTHEQKGAGAAGSKGNNGISKKGKAANSTGMFAGLQHAAGTKMVSITEADRKMKFKSK